MYAEVTNIYGKSKSSIHEIVEKKEINVSFAIAPQNTKIMASVHDKCLVNMEKA